MFVFFYAKSVGMQLFVVLVIECSNRDHRRLLCRTVYYVYYVSVFSCFIEVFIVDFFVISAALQMRVNPNAFFENKGFNQYNLTS